MRLPPRVTLAADLGHGDWAKGRSANPFATWLGLSIHAGSAVLVQIIATRRKSMEEELARERASLAYLITLTTARAVAGCRTIDLVIRTLEAGLV